MTIATVNAWFEPHDSAQSKKTKINEIINQINTNTSDITTITSDITTITTTDTESIKSGMIMHGGGTITVDGSYRVGWTARFIVIDAGRGSNFATNGYFDITQPTSGTITAVGGGTANTWNSSGIVIPSWQALYYILPTGSTSTSLSANFRMVGYGSDVDIPANWILIAAHNGDTGNHIRFGNGIILNASETFVVGTNSSVTGSTDSAAIHDNVAGEIHSITEITTIASDDELLVEDTDDARAKKRITVDNFLTLPKTIYKNNLLVLPMLQTILGASTSYNVGDAAALIQLPVSTTGGAAGFAMSFYLPNISSSTVTLTFKFYYATSTASAYSVKHRVTYITTGSEVHTSIYDSTSHDFAASAYPTVSSVTYSVSSIVCNSVIGVRVYSDASNTPLLYIYAVAVTVTA